MSNDYNSYDYNNEDFEEFDDDQANFFQVNSLRDSTLFLVDCSKNMFSKDEDQDCLFQKCMKAIRKMYQIKIYDNDKEYVGVLFFGTEKNNSGEDNNDFEHIFELQGLKEPSAERIKELDKFTSDFDLKKFRSDYGHSDMFSLQKVFWYCSNMFSSADKKLGMKRIIFFTANSNPHKDNKDYERLAKSKYKDLNDIGIKFDIIPLVKKEQKFDYSDFYADMLMISPEELFLLSDPADTFDEIMSNVREKVHKKRPYTHLNLNLTEGCSISCSVYNLVRECPKPTKIKLDKKNNVETTSVTHRYAPETGEVLFASDTKLAIDVCSKRVTFEQDEVKLLKRFGQTGMKLLGFKALNSLKPYMYVKPGHFLYPDEKEIEGSTTLFKALLDKCIQREKFILCEIVVRSNTSPRLAALIPQQEEFDEEVKTIQKHPPGFHVAYLPYADDLRQIDRVIEAKSSDDSVDLFRNCVKKLKFTYDYSMFRNPALQKLWYQVESIALDLEKPEEVEDLTLPNNERLEKRAGVYLKEFAEKFALTGETFKGKRKTADANASVAAKKTKIEEIDVEAEARAGRIEKLTVPVLKDFIKTKSISVSGTRKDDLIKAIKKNLGL